MIELGDEVKSIITGHKGVVIGISEWLTGCRTVGVKATKMEKDGKEAENIWHDEVTLKITKKHALKWAGRVKAKTKDKGGPRETPQRTLAPGR